MIKTNETNVTKLLKRLVETKAETIKLGMDLHARDVVVCVQLDGALPQRPQKMTTPELLALARGLLAAGRKVYSCYESGPCGYTLHRDLLAAGVTNYVVAAEVLGDARHQKTDNLDATALTDRLDRYVRGNTAAFTVNTVPTPEQNRPAPAAACANNSSAPATNGLRAARVSSSPKAITSPATGGRSAAGKNCNRPCPRGW